LWLLYISCKRISTTFCIFLQIEAAAKNAISPEAIVDDMLRSIGACALRDLGGLAWGTRMGTFFLPYNFFAELFATAAPFMPDWKTHNKHR
jgi:hypothetical protein